MPGSPRRDSDRGGIEGRGTRSRSLESQPRSRHPAAGTLATGRVEPPRTGGVGAIAAEDMEAGRAGPGVGVSDRWQASASAHGEHDDRWAHRWLEDRADQGRRGVAHTENVQTPTEASREASNSRNQPDTAELLRQALLGIVPKPEAPRLTASTQAACGEFIRQWGEYKQNETPVRGDNTMRNCMAENTLATVCYLGDFPTTRVQAISDADLLECLRSVVQPYSSISAVAMYSRLQVAAATVPPPSNANDVHRHVLATWEATRNAVTEANCWSLFKDTSHMWGTWKSAAGKSFSKVFVEALRPRQFRESVRNELIIDDTAMEDPQALSRRIMHLAAKWPEIQRVVDAAMDDAYGRGRGGRGRAGEDGREHREHYERLGEPGSSGPARDQRGRLDNYRGRPDDLYSSKECSHCGHTGHLEPQCWTKYPQLRPVRPPARPSDSFGDQFPARFGVQSAPTTPSRVDGRDRAPARGAGGSPGWSASAGNSPAGFRGGRPGWSAEDGRPAGGSSPGRQQPPSGDARRNPREDRGTPARRASAGLGSRRVARLEPDQPESGLSVEHGDPAFLLPVEEQDLDVETVPEDNPGRGAVSRVMSAMDATATRSDGMHGTVRLSPTGVGDGNEIEGRVLLDTGSQINVISRGMFTKLQANYPLNTLIKYRSFSVVLADQAVAHAVGITEPLNVTVTSGIAGPVQLSSIEFTVLEGEDDLLLLGHPTMVAKLGINVERMLTNLPATVAEGEIRCAVASLAAARGVAIDPDPSEALLTDRAPSLLSATDEELQERVHLLKKRVDKAAQAGMSSEALGDLAQAVLVEFAGSFRAGLRMEDPPADVPAMKVQLLPGARPVQARARRAAPDKARFIKNFVPTLVAAGMVVAALGSLYASPAMAVVKPSSVKVTVKVKAPADRPAAKERGSATPTEIPRAWDPVPLDSASESTGKGPVKHRMVIDYSVVNSHTEPDPYPVPLLNEQGLVLAGYPYYMSLDIYKGFWQIPLHEDSQEIFTFITPEGLWKPLRMPQGCCNATAHFVGVMDHVLGPLIGDVCVVYVDDIVIFATSELELVQRTRMVLERLQRYGLYASAEKSVFFTTEVNWCGKLYSAAGVRHDPARIEGLLSLRRPETGGELQHFLAAVNWMHRHLPELARVNAPLRDLMETLLRNVSRRTKRAATAKKITSAEWTPDCDQSWTQVKHLLGECVTLAQPCKGCTVMVFTDASDLHWGAMVTQVPDEDLRSGMQPSEMRHAPLAFVSGSFTNFKLRWATLDKEAFAIVETFRRLEWLLWSGPVICTDHRNLIYIFHPHTAVSKLSKATSQRLLNWATYLGIFKYSIRHIAGTDNLWGDLLSRWISPPTSTRSLAVRAPLPEVPTLEGELGRNANSLPSVDAIRGVQMQYATLKGEDSEFPSSFELANGDQVSRAGDGVYAMAGTGALWIPEEEAKELQLRLLVCGHCGEAGHRGKGATMDRLRPACYWTQMEKDVGAFVNDCLNCVDSRGGGKIPRPFGETTHGTEVNACLHFDYLYIGTGIEKVQPLAKGRANERCGVDDRPNDGEHGMRGDGNQNREQSPADSDDDTKYILVLKEDITGFVMLEPASAANAENAAAGLQRWCTTLGVPSVLVSDTATHFKNHLLAKLTTLLGVDHRFAVANSPWSNGTVENVMEEVLRVLKALLVEYRSAVTDWEHFVPMVQWALNSSYRARLGGSPYKAWFGREPTTLLASLVRDQHEVVGVVPLTDASVRAMVENLAIAVDAMHKRVTHRVQSVRAAGRQRESKGWLPNFAVGDYVLMARVRPPGKTSKLMSTWTGPWRVTNAPSPHVYQVQDIVSGHVTTAHVARLKFYRDSSLGITEYVQEAFQYLFNQGEFHLEELVEVWRAPDGAYEALVQWRGFAETERSWESLATLYRDAPTYLLKKLTSLKLPLTTRKAILRRHDIRISSGAGARLPPPTNGSPPH